GGHDAGGDDRGGPARSVLVGNAAVVVVGGDPADRRPLGGARGRLRGRVPGGRGAGGDEPGRGRSGGDADRGVPAGAVLAGRHDDLLRRQRPADHVHRPGGAEPAAVPAVRAGQAAAAALPGSGDEVLPARRVLLGVLPLRAGAAVRLRRFGAVGGDRERDRGVGPVEHAAVRRSGAAADRVVVQGFGGAVPHLDAGRVPGRSHRCDRFHGGVHEGRRVRGDPAGAAGGLHRVLLGVAGSAVGPRDRVGGDRGGGGAHAAGHQAGDRLLVGGARRGHAGRRPRGGRPGAFGAILRVLQVAFTVSSWEWRGVLWAIAIASMVIGVVLALTQQDIKRMIAYSSVAHAGFMLVGAIALTDRGLSGTMFYLLAY